MSKEESQTVDLRSDTVTRPTQGMREAMAAAVVGDDVLGEDPTINQLQGRVAEMLGKEASLFVPSGTMANLLAVLSQTRPGETVILSEDAHPYNYEGGNVAVVGGVLTRTIRGHCGMMTREDVEPYIMKIDDHHLSETTLIATEHTTNRGGGQLYDVATLAGLAELAREYGMKVHCDGARLFNAVVESGVSAAEYARHADTLCFCFSKGLGAPVGSILAGPAETIDRAHRFRKMLGGGMRQAGVLAAAALYALDHNVDRLRDDHRRARRFREALLGLDGIEFPFATPTNIVMLDVADVYSFVGTVREQGVQMLAMGPTRARAVFHLDITDDGVERAIEACKRAARGS